MTQLISCIECYKHRPGGRCQFCPLHAANKESYTAIGDGMFIRRSDTDKKETNKMSATGKQVVVRKATRQDRPQIIRLMKGYLDFYHREHPADDKIHKLLDTLEQQPGRGLQFIAEVDGQAAGFATLYSTFSTLSCQEAMVMNDLFVDPQVRASGVGYQLFEACRKHVEANGYAYMEWVTATDNVNAQRFYERQGATRSNWLMYSI